MADIKISRNESIEIFEALALRGYEHSIEFCAEEGDWVTIGIDFLGEVAADLINEEGEIVEWIPEKNVNEIDHAGNGFLGRAYRIARSGIYKLAIRAERAAATVIKFGRETGLALVGRGRPNNTTCYVCKKTVSVATKSVLAANSIIIPSIDDIEIDIEAIMAPLNIDIEQLQEQASGWVPPAVYRRIREPLRICFEVLSNNLLERLPQVLRDPVGWAAKQGCQLIGLCAAP